MTGRRELAGEERDALEQQKAEFTTMLESCLCYLGPDYPGKEEEIKIWRELIEKGLTLDEIAEETRSPENRRRRWAARRDYGFKRAQRVELYGANKVLEVGSGGAITGYGEIVVIPVVTEILVRVDGPMQLTLRVTKERQDGSGKYTVQNLYGGSYSITWED